MIYVCAGLLALVNLLWLGLTLLTLPGNWLMVLTTILVAWWQWDRGMFSPWTLGVLVALAGLGEVLEFLGSAVGVSKAGGTRWGGLGSILGAVAGALAGTVLIPVPLVGTLVGVCAGAGLGAWVLELAVGRTQRESVRAGVGAGVGRLAATLLKLGIGLLIWLIAAVAAFWP
ncbi:MAG TPA: DUF456 family protein [Phycisphaerae bacterium]|nr:DUF456 family protein [Phycisphaerae bacterium]